MADQSELDVDHSPEDLGGSGVPPEAPEPPEVSSETRSGSTGAKSTSRRPIPNDGDASSGGKRIRGSEKSTNSESSRASRAARPTGDDLPESFSKIDLTTRQSKDTRPGDEDRTNVYPEDLQNADTRPAVKSRRSANVSNARASRDASFRDAQRQAKKPSSDPAYPQMRRSARSTDVPSGAHAPELEQHSSSSFDVDVHRDGLNEATRQPSSIPEGSEEGQDSLSHDDEASPAWARGEITRSSRSKASKFLSRSRTTGVHSSGTSRTWTTTRDRKPTANRDKNQVVRRRPANSSQTESHDRGDRLEYDSDKRRAMAEKIRRNYGNIRQKQR